MAKTKPKNKARTHSPRIENRRALHDYHIHEKLECGIMLAGTEVKSVRNGQVSLAEGFARVEPRDGQLYLYNVEISHYPQASEAYQHETKRPRKLLAHKREIARLAGETSSKGTTLVPLAMYFSNGRVKVEIGVATGKKAHDKRQDIKKREHERDMRRAMTRKRL